MGKSWRNFPEPGLPQTVRLLLRADTQTHQPHEASKDSDKIHHSCGCVHIHACAHGCVYYIKYITHECVCTHAQT